MVKCEICNKELNTNRALGAHIRNSHNIQSKEYYDLYLKKEDEDICPVCGKETKFTNISAGYYRTCSNKCAAKNPERAEKIKNTVLKKYGVSNTYLLPEIRQKAMSGKTQESYNKAAITKKEKYGYSNPFENKQIQEKAIQASHSDTANKKRTNTFLTLLDKFEKNNNCTRISKLVSQYGQGWLKIKDTFTLLHNGQYTYIKNDEIDKIKEYAKSEHYFHGSSNIEKEILEYIKSIYSGNIIKNTRKIIRPYELDIYIPDKQLAIECNGIYWHSIEILNDKKYHLSKSLKCQEKGIRLIHIYETEWLNNQEKIKYLLQEALGQSKRIYARQCEIREITNREAKILNDKVHLQGHRNAQITYGLFYQNELVQLMSFSKTKYNRNLKDDNSWEIIRGCPGSNTSVVGGVSKLFKYFIKQHNPNKIFSYCDFNKFDGRSYEAIGMKCIGYTGPNKWWIIDKLMVTRNPKRYKELKNKAAGIVWGAGSKKYLWEKVDEDN